MILAMRLQSKKIAQERASNIRTSCGSNFGGNVKPSAKKSGSTMPNYPVPKSQEEADRCLALEMQRRLDNGGNSPTVFEQLTFKPAAATPVTTGAGARSPPLSNKAQHLTICSFGGGGGSAPPPAAPTAASSPQQQQQSTSATAPRTNTNTNADLTATSLFGDSAALPSSTSNKSTTASSQQQQQQSNNAVFDPFSTTPAPAPAAPAGETDFFDNFLSQRKDLHKQQQQQQSGPPPPPPTSAGASTSGTEFFSTQSSAAPANNASTGGTDLFELQMQRLSSTTTAAQPARGMTLDDMLRDGKSF